MIGSYPMVSLAPLRYRYALDAARMLLPRTTAPFVHCTVAKLEDEVRQRFPRWADRPNEETLWVEPMATTWRAVLARIARSMPTESSLVVIVAQPLARIMPDQYVQDGRPLGLQLGGVRRFRRAVATYGFTLQDHFGIHTLPAIMLNLCSRTAARLGRPDIGDRLEFAARLRYCVQGPISVVGAVAVLSFQRGRSY
ncbi:MAG: hypothetical protein NVSMB42_00560 [Herpetosiphon sp.]